MNGKQVISDTIVCSLYTEMFTDDVTAQQWDWTAEAMVLFVYRFIAPVTPAVLSVIRDTVWLFVEGCSLLTTKKTSITEKQLHRE